jgi:hypothetical protein
MEIGALPQAHVCPAIHGVHCPEQELQAPTAQSEAWVHFRPSSHLGHSGPPQSTSVSEPSLLPSLHLAPLVPPVPPFAIVVPPLLVVPPLAVVPPLCVAVPPLFVEAPPLAMAPPLFVEVPPFAGAPPLLDVVPPLFDVVPPLFVALAPPLPDVPPAPEPPSTAPGSCSGLVPTQTLSRHACPTMRHGSETGLHTVRH